MLPAWLWQYEAVHAAHAAALFAPSASVSILQLRDSLRKIKQHKHIKQQVAQRTSNIRNKQNQLGRRDRGS
jgi:hypothetical protein